MKFAALLMALALLGWGCAKLDTGILPSPTPTPPPTSTPPGYSYGRLTAEVRRESFFLSGIGVRITGPENRNPLATNSSGQAVFDNLTPGNYTISISGFGNSISFAETMKLVYVPPGGDIKVVFVGTAFTAPATATIIGLVWEDANNNGQYDLGEAVFAGLGVTLDGTDMNKSNVRLQTQVGTDGWYKFTGLMGGSYNVIVTNPNVSAFRFDFEKSGVVSQNVTINDFHGTIFTVYFRAVRR